VRQERRPKGDVVWHRQSAAEFMVSLLQRPGSTMTPNTESSRVQGEGDKDAARRYNDATKRFVDSGAVAEAARNAEPRTPEQAKELEDAEREGRDHAKGEDPQVQRP
jgi:hypothetical protein